MRREPWLRSFVFAGRGLGRVWRYERNFRVQLAAGWAAVLLALLLRLPGVQGLLLVGISAAVLAAETMNSALEVLVDLVSPEPHPLAGVAKDLGAGAVLGLSAGAVVVGSVLFVPHLAQLPSAIWAATRTDPVAFGLGCLVLAALVVSASVPMPRRGGDRR